MSESDRLAIVIPALNEAATIRRVVSEARQYGAVLVVDDGSDDGTQELAKSSGALVVRHERSCGYERSLSAGMLTAHQLGYEFAITMDADGQHSAEYLELFINELSLGRNIVTSDRGARPRLGELIFCFVSKILWGIPDPLSGMKGYNLVFLEQTGLLAMPNIIGAYTAIAGVVKFKAKTQCLKITISSRQDAPRFGNVFSANLKIMSALLRVVFRIYIRPNDKLAGANEHSTGI